MTGLRLDDIHKALGGRRVLRGATLRVEPAQVLAILGDNGVGKTTLLRIAAGLLRADQGTRDAPNRVGFAGHEPALYGHLTAAEQLVWWASVHQMPVPADGAEKALATAGLATVADTRCSKLSRGQRQRLALAQAMLPEPDLLVLDEPWTGLDQAGRGWLEDRLGASAAPVLLTSHDAATANRVATTVLRLTPDGRLAEVVT